MAVILLPSETFPKEFSTICQSFQKVVQWYTRLGIHNYPGYDILTREQKDSILKPDMDVVVHHLKQDLDIADSLVFKCISDRRDLEKDRLTIQCAIESFKLFIDRLRRHLKQLSLSLLEDFKDASVHWSVERVILSTKIMAEQSKLEHNSELSIYTFIINHIHALVSQDNLSVEDIAAFMLLMR